MKKLLYALLIGVMVFAFVGCGDSSDTSEGDVEETVAEETTEAAAEFDPKDVSDETIESIETYGDYLTMYGLIIDDYIDNYENAVKGTLLYDEATFQQLKDECNKSLEEQEEEYGAMKDQKVVGKDDLVQFLKDYRDELQEFVDTMEESL